MAKPRVFISSTYYDLKHLRSSLDIFVEGLGFDSILSEKGDIAYSPDVPLDESCYREVETADIFVLLIGGRYGAEATSDQKKPSRQFFDRYESITKKEYESALLKDIPTYIMIETSVYSEYHTFLRNKDNTSISYAHVDSANIFRLIEEILSKPRNNPTHTFERFADIEIWLREQWAGLFRELLNKRSQQQQLAALSLQVTDLKETNNTLKKYLEAVMSGITPAASSELIESEQKRLAEIEKRERLIKNTWCTFTMDSANVSLEVVVKALSAAKSIEDLAKRIGKISKLEGIEERIVNLLTTNDTAKKHFDQARSILGLTSLDGKVTDEKHE